MNPPCVCECNEDVPAVFGYGDANADFYLVGDHPGVHGGRETGVPFTGTDAGYRLQSVCYEVGFAATPGSASPEYSNLFTSYRFMCCPPDGADPSPTDYDDLERFFDAELRAINPHIIMPVGERSTAAILDAYTTQAHKIDLDMARLHAIEVRGRGFLVVPIRDPTEWESGDRDRIVETLESILASDYRQTKGVATLVG